MLKVAANGAPTRLRVQQVRDQQLFEMDGERKQELAPWSGKSLVYVYDVDGRCNIESEQTKKKKKKKSKKKRRKKRRRRRAQVQAAESEASSDLGCPPLSFGLYPVGAVRPGEPWTPQPAAVRAALGLAPEVGLTIKSSAMRLLGVEEPADQPRYARIGWKLRCDLRFPDATTHEWDVMISIKRSLSSFVDIERKVEGKRVIMEPASAGGMRFEGDVSTSFRVAVERRPGVEP